MSSRVETFRLTIRRIVELRITDWQPNREFRIVHADGFVIENFRLTIRRGIESFG